MSEFWKELKAEVENEVVKCVFRYTDTTRYFCGKHWIPCAHLIATGQCEMLNRKGKEVEDER